MSLKSPFFGSLIIPLLFGAAPNSPDSLSGAVVQTPNSVSCVDGSVPNSNSALNNVNSKETIDIDNEDINDKAYETSSEGLLSDDESSDNESDNEEESSTYINNGSKNVVPSHNVLSDNESSANMEIETENEVPSTHPPSSGNIVSPGSKLAAAVDKGCGSCVSAKIPRAAGAGVHKAGSSRTVGLNAGLRKAARDWSVLSKLRN